MNTFINRTLPAAASSYNILRKIENIPSIFSLPYFAVHNPKSRDVFYTVYLLYGAIYRAQLIRSFTKFDLKRYCTRSFCYTRLCPSGKK